MEENNDLKKNNENLKNDYEKIKKEMIEMKKDIEIVFEILKIKDINGLFIE